jgi:hypothetical protein
MFILNIKHQISKELVILEASLLHFEAPTGIMSNLQLKMSKIWSTNSQAFYGFRQHPQYFGPSVVRAPAVST